MLWQPLLNRGLLRGRFIFQMWKRQIIVAFAHWVVYVGPWFVLLFLILVLHFVFMHSNHCCSHVHVCHAAHQNIHTLAPPNFTLALFLHLPPLYQFYVLFSCVVCCFQADNNHLKVKKEKSVRCCRVSVFLSSHLLFPVNPLEVHCLCIFFRSNIYDILRYSNLRFRLGAWCLCQ